MCCPCWRCFCNAVAARACGTGLSQLMSACTECIDKVALDNIQEKKANMLGAAGR